MIAIEGIRDALARANGRRRERLMSEADVEMVVGSVRSGQPWAYRSGGQVAVSYNYHASTTLAMAARVDGRIYLGIGASDAKSPTPGRVWACLQPFGRGNMEAKIRQWIELPGVFPID